MTKHVIHSYSGNVVSLFRDGIPTHLPAGFWNNKMNRKTYLDWLGKKLDYRDMNDWYKLTSDIVVQNHGNGLIQRYNDSPSAALKEIYPDHDWLPWKFSIVPKGFWDNP